MPRKRAGGRKVSCDIGHTNGATNPATCTRARCHSERMERAQWIGVVAAACLLTGAGVAVAQTPAPPPPPPPAPVPPALSATLDVCQPNALPALRVASFTGSMPAIAGAERMQMRFELQRRRSFE